MAFLARTQRNRIAELASEAGLALADFDWQDVPSQGAYLSSYSKLTHLPTGSRFSFYDNGVFLVARARRIRPVTANV
jgi:hypothetical protein